MPQGLQVYDTQGLAPSVGVAFWHDVVCRSFVPLECTTRAPDFRGAISRLELGDYSVSTVRSGAQSVERTRRLIGAADDAHYLLSLGVHGTGQVIQDGRDTMIFPGMFALYNSTRPYRLNFDQDFEQIVFMMPVSALGARFGRAEHLTATRIDRNNPLADLTASFLSGLLKVTHQMSDILMPRLAAQATELVATMLIATSTHVGPSTSHRLAMGLQIRNAIENRLRDPDLNRATLAAQFRISTRYLDGLFADEGLGIAEYILKRRLEIAREALADPSRDRYQIGEIARMSGFVSQSHFSRRFALAYSLTPRDYRNVHRHVLNKEPG